MDNVEFIGPLVNIEVLVLNKITQKLSTVPLTVGNRYSIMTSISAQCRTDINVQKLLKLTIDSFNGAATASEVSSIIPRIINGIIDAMLDSQQQEEKALT